MEWFKSLSKPVKYGAAAGTGIGIASIAAYYVYLKTSTPENTIQKSWPSSNKPVEVESEKTFVIPEVIIDIDSDVATDEWVTPAVSAEYVPSNERESEIPMQLKKKEPVEDISINDGFSEQKPSRKVLLLGLENSGKSSLLSQLSREGTNCMEYEPTKGFNVVCISFDNIDLSIWEIGGGPEYRTYWKNFCSATDLIIFVIDSTDQEKFQMAKEYFFSIIDDLSDEIDFHVVATKADKDNSASVKEIHEALGLEGIKWDIIKIAVQAGGAKENIGVEQVQHFCLHQ